MHYLSTRGQSGPKTFQDVVFEGQAPDGGLYLPAYYPEIAIPAGSGFLEIAQKVMAPFAPGIDMPSLLAKAWEGFPKGDPAPIKEINDNLFLMELFNGPTLSFKDFGLQFLGAIFEDFCKTPLNIIGATSGDTGAAAVHALKNKKNIRLFMLHPKGLISDLQRRQMTTVMAPNIFNIAVQGTFDECQQLMKWTLEDGKFTTVNSINWGRILAQTTYYWWAALKQGQGSPVHFVVPSGNFGNAFSGFVAKLCGAPISGITVATNANDILPRTLKTGIYKPGRALATISPAMDIQRANNFERLLFETSNRNPEVVRSAAQSLVKTGAHKIPEGSFQKICNFFQAASASEDETLLAIKEVYQKTGQILDPHTAVGFAVWKKVKTNPKTPTVLLGTAHPGKFPETLHHAILMTPPLPAALASLKQGKEVCQTMAADAGDLKKFIDEKIYVS